MTNVNSSAVRHALNQTTAAREAIGYFIQRILQQFNNVNHSWNDQQSRRLYAIVLDSVTSLRTSYGELRSLEESLKKTLDTVEKYEQIGRATRTTAAAGVAAAASVASAGTKTAVSIRPSIKQDKPFSSPKYNAILDQRYGNAVPAARKVFDLFAEKLCILNGDYSGPEPSHYSPAEHGVYYNAAEDEKNVRGAGATYYHAIITLPRNRGKELCAIFARERGTAVRISQILLPMAMFVVDGVIAKNTAQEYGPWSMRRLHTFLKRVWVIASSCNG